MARLMPELPDITVYLDALQSRLPGQTLKKVRLASPFVLRTVEPSPRDLEGKKVTGLRRLGKRIVLEFEDNLFLVIHLMIAGRFKWLERGQADFARNLRALRQPLQSAGNH